MTDRFDLDRARRDTRACAQIVHFNNAGASLMPAPVADCLHAYLRQEEQIGGYETAEAERAQLDDFYPSIATLIGATPTRSPLSRTPRAAWDMAFYSLDFKPGDRILTCVSEYSSNYISYLQVAKKTGAEIVVVPDDSTARSTSRALERAIDKRTKLVSISPHPDPGRAGAAGRGGRQDRQRCRHPLPARCLPVGRQMPIDVKKIGCDFLSATGRKYMRGPRGTGFLYARTRSTSHIEPIFLDNHAARWTGDNDYTVMGDAKRFENWERYFAGKAALGVAIDYALSYSLEAIRDRVYGLARELRAGLLAIDGVQVTDEGVEQCGIVTFQAAQLPPAQIKEQLRAHRINVTTPRGSGSLVSFQQRGLSELVRASLHYYNSEEEVDYFLHTLRRIL